MKRTFIFFVTLLFILGGSTLSAQHLKPEEQALSNLKSEYAQLGLTATDVAELRISDDYESNGIRHIYVQQFYQGVPVYNGIAGMHFKDGKLAYRTSNFSTGFDEQLPLVRPAATPFEAVVNAARPLDITKSTSPIQVSRKDNQLVYHWPEVSQEPITAQLIFADIDGKLELSWQVYINQINTPDIWLTQVDAATGSPIQRFNQTLYCSFNGADNHGQKNSHMHEHGHEHGRDCFAELPAINPNLPVHESMLEASLMDGSTYNVFPFGIEAPTYGERELISEPADPEASPFGWHDTNGQEGAEYTITRGNNVRAYPDRSDSNSPDTDVVVDGGDDLQFDFFYEDGGNLDSILPAATAQLFYMCNMIHDFTWHHGFDEASGNFQQNNYGNGGTGNDAVQAEAQDGSGTNNANFSTPADGGSGRMQMYVWQNSGSNRIIIEEPASLAGNVQVGAAQFGPQELAEDVTAKVVLALDGTDSPELVCESVMNGDDVTGRIALIRRGDCFFEQKVLNAQAAGAVGVIICNPENQLLNMAGGVDDDEPTIPSALIEEFRCAEIRMAINNGEDVTITFPATVTPPPIDGDFDNGIVAHEYAHGISNRLVGGPSAAGCLTNGEQMGEGWSDFFSLVTSPLNGAETMPTGAEPRGIGNFATNAGPNGNGIRRKRYSRDLQVNDFTYDDVITSGVPHPLGEIWATTLWDLYWAMVDVHGFDSTLVTGNGGNNMAVKLVIEGMKNTTCSPGMVDGRDGILIADELLYDGANQCLIWEVFARRGLGWSADQGSSDTGTDGVEAFDVNPACIPTVKLDKETDETLVDAGEGFRVTLRIRNDKEDAVTNVVITDELPEGLTVVDGSVSGTSSFEVQPGSISFTIPGIDPGEDAVVRYDVTTSADLNSIKHFFDGAENGDDEWSIFPLNNEGVDLWSQSELEPFEGDFVWFVPNAATDNDQVILPIDPLFLEGSQPGVRFYTKYNTETKWDAGIIEMSTDGTNWTNVGNDRLLRGKYRGEVEASAFDASVSDFNSYWGFVQEYQDVLIDFSDMAGQEIYLRWRFGSDGSDAAANGSTPGWWIDNVEVMDVFRYNGEATLVTAEGDNANAFGQDGGVLIESKLPVSVVDPVLGTTKVNVFPNPANDYLKVRINSQNGGEATVQLLSVDGRVVAQQVANLAGGSHTAEFSTTNLASGVYLVQVMGADRVHTEKVTIQ